MKHEAPEGVDSTCATRGTRRAVLRDVQRFLRAKKLLVLALAITTACAVNIAAVRAAHCARAHAFVQALSHDAGAERSRAADAHDDSGSTDLGDDLRCQDRSALPAPPIVALAPISQRAHVDPVAHARGVLVPFSLERPPRLA